MTMKRISLHVDRLVLHGVAHGHEVAGALQAELTRLLSDPGVIDGLASVGTVDRLRATPLRVATGAGPKGLGAQAARSIVKAGRA